MNKRKNEALKALENNQFELARELLLQLSEVGDIEMQCELGTMYQLGLGGNRDLIKAVYWLEKSAKSGFGLAAHNLGTLYMTCQPDWPSDPSKSKKWRILSEQLGYLPFNT